MPEAAKAHTAAGAEAFVKFYWEMVDYASGTGDTAGLKALAIPGCQACNGGVQGLEAIYRQSGHIRGGSTSVTHPRTAPFRSGPSHGYVVNAEVTNARQVIDFPGKKRDVVHAGATVPVRFIVNVTPAGLAMAYWDRTS